MLEMLIELSDRFNIDPEVANLAARALLGVAVLLAAVLAWIIARVVLLWLVRRAVKRTDTKWDDRLLEKKVFGRAAHLAPAVVIYLLAGVPLADHARAIAMTQSAANIYMLIVGAMTVSALLNGAHAIYRAYDVSQRIPIRGFLQVIKGVLFFVVGIFVLSILMNESPKFFLGGLGALTAVLMLVFKDPILGLVGGIQLSTNDMVRIGDWISMPKFNADGDVIDISLTTVKVQNFDKTITTIPTYALISDSMKNWRGMSDSGGRRICRNINLDLNTVRFCTPEMLERFRKIEFIQEYLETKAEEVATYNTEHGVDESVEINGRRLTNIGTFRAYVENYLRNHPRIYKEGMTFLVRQLAPGATGVPIQIYVFTKTVAWVDYEWIQADIFDHLLAAVPEFDLRVFQEPTDAQVAVRLSVPDGVEARVTTS
jgi:miniconductance mechanosensitive channel